MKTNYKVRWVESVEYELVVEADSREEAINEVAAFHGGNPNSLTGWMEWETDLLAVEARLEGSEGLARRATQPVTQVWRCIFKKSDEEV